MANNSCFGYDCDFEEPGDFPISDIAEGNLCDDDFSGITEDSAIIEDCYRTFTIDGRRPPCRDPVDRSFPSQSRQAMRRQRMNLQCPNDNDEPSCSRSMALDFLDDVCNRYGCDLGDDNSSRDNMSCDNPVERVFENDALVDLIEGFLGREQQEESCLNREEPAGQVSLVDINRKRCYDDEGEVNCPRNIRRIFRSEVNSNCSICDELPSVDTPSTNSICNDDPPCRIPIPSSLQAAGNCQALIRELSGLPASATENEIISAYRKASKLCHPDKGGSASDFRCVKWHYDVRLAMLKKIAKEDVADKPDGCPPLPFELDDNFNLVERPGFGSDDFTNWYAGFAAGNAAAGAGDTAMGDDFSGSCFFNDTTGPDDTQTVATITGLSDCLNPEQEDDLDTLMGEFLASVCGDTCDIKDDIACDLESLMSGLTAEMPDTGEGEECEETPMEDGGGPEDGEEEAPMEEEEEELAPCSPLQVDYDDLPQTVDEILSMWADTEAEDNNCPNEEWRDPVKDCDPDTVVSVYEPTMDILPGEDDHEELSGDEDTFITCLTEGSGVKPSLPKPNPKPVVVVTVASDDDDSVDDGLAGVGEGECNATVNGEEISFPSLPTCATDGSSSGGKTFPTCATDGSSNGGNTFLTCATNGSSKGGKTFLPCATDGSSKGDNTFLTCATNGSSKGGKTFLTCATDGSIDRSDRCSENIISFTGNTAGDSITDTGCPDIFDMIPELPEEVGEEICMEKCRRLQEYMRKQGCGGIIQCRKRPIPREPGETKKKGGCFAQAIARCE